MLKFVSFLIVNIYLCCLATSNEPLKQNASHKIDQFLLKDASIKEFPSIDDITYLRRIYLETIGRIPRPDEIKEFLASTTSNKRDELVRTLLNSEEFSQYFYNFFADQLRIQKRIKGDYKEFYESWLKNALKDNMPYDKLVRELVNAKGHISENGAAGYYLRDQAKVLEIASTTAQIFLGTQIGCAQCHNHAFEDWTQKQFYEFAAYLGTVETMDRKEARMIQNKFKLGDLEPRERNILRNIIENAKTEVSDNPRKKLRLPEDYKYDNAKPKEVVSPKVFMGTQPDLLKYPNPREAFAYWLTDKNNPRFTKIIVNRLWKKTMGRGLFEPVDDYTDQTLVHHPELLAYLENLFIELNYDLRSFQEILYNTKHYQVPATDTEFSKSKYEIAARPLFRMKAEQVWNSILVIARKDFESAKGNKRQSEVDDLVTEFRTKNAVQLEADKEIILNRIQQLASNPKDKRKNKNPPVVAKDTMSEMSMQSTMLPKNTETMTPVEAIKVEPEPKKVVKVQKPKVTKTKQELNEEKLEKDSKNALKSFIGRASDITTPAPENHILNYFGQSDRDIIKDGDSSPNLPQVLALINDRMTTNIIVKYSLVKRQLNKLKTPQEKVDHLYLSILNRYPSVKEKQTASTYLEKNTNQKIEDMIWILINTREFLFIQ